MILVIYCTKTYYNTYYIQYIHISLYIYIERERLYAYIYIYTHNYICTHTSAKKGTAGRWTPWLRTNGVNTNGAEL